MMIDSVEVRPIQICKTRYGITNFGLVYRFAREIVRCDGRIQKISAKRLTPHLNHHGYVYYTLYLNDIRYEAPAHRLVALTWIGPPPPGKPLVLHKDDDLLHNRVENLYWGTHLDNHRDAVRNGRQWTSEDISRAIHRALLFKHLNSL
jgi:hypothetical protein